MLGFVILIADILHDLFARRQLQPPPHLPWLGVRAGIVDRDFEFQVAQIDPPEALNHMKLFGLRAAAVEPAPVVEADRIDYQRVLLPSADRMALPARLEIGWV